jgi:hypothetical protein
MKRVFFYLASWVLVVMALFIAHKSAQLPEWMNDFSLIFYCILMGVLGGCLYCLRGIYQNACVRGTWDDKWLPWYFIRPITSGISGGVSWLFLSAGLLVLDAEQSTGSSDIGFLALAFIAGLNVDKFISKIEQVAQATWGIEQSRSSSEEKK